MRSQAVQGLPSGVSLAFGSPSRLEVEFQTLEELAERLIQAGLALDRNFDHYASLLETGANSSAQTEEDLEQTSERHKQEQFELSFSPPSKPLSIGSHSLTRC
jgi:hypothetical protein